MNFQTDSAYTAGKKQSRFVWQAVLLALTVAVSGCGDSQDSAGKSSTTTGSSTISHEKAAPGSEGSIVTHEADAPGAKGSATSSDTGNTAVTEKAGVSKTTEDRAYSEAFPPEKKPQPEPQAGMLTAGEWDDNGSWSRWLKLIGSEGRDGILQSWGIVPDQRLTVKVTAEGVPARDTKVLLQCSDRTEWSARTDNKGVAYLFGSLLSSGETDVQNGAADSNLNSSEAPESNKRREAVGEDCIVSVPELKSAPSHQVAQQDWKNENVVSINTSNKPKQPDRTLDLMLMVDTTGSMADELNYLSKELVDVVSRVQKKNGQSLNIRISPNFYRDHGDEYTVRPFPFQKDSQQAQDRIAEQEADGGQDYPEAVDEALKNAIGEHDWSESAQARLLLLVLDAPPHRGQSELREIQQMTEAAAAKGIRIVPVAASGTDLETELLMRSLAAATGGTYVFLTDDSGIGGSHKKPEGIEPQIMPFNDLLVELISRYAAV
ncbi:VWA domain-containing protein [Paenibacillus pasadenensis]|uniref:vWA domain-containing protein n=1 Tax=Paenibacillus pasadenensis TaxID=217090 RepID=UPI00203F669F|nr:vWA domain-containing protein [Paenibacillus pasadenensis]MCM3749906.1 VWA domain-containing protein [Paenibacillus pasadenensis]